VPVTDALNNYKYLKKGELMRTKGLGHNRILKNKDVVDRIVQFAEKE
jgi:hypothetical protein